MSALQHTFWDEACAQALSDRALLAAMARFEAALARAAAQAGIVPAADAEAIARVCESAEFDAPALAAEARQAGVLTIPFVKRLTAQVAAASPSAARYVHLGATSQDVLDTATVLCLRPAGERVRALAQRLGNACAALARDHACTPMSGRTLLQAAVPIPLGWKAAVWLSLLTRSRAGFRRAEHEASRLQFGGASGTLSAYGAQGMRLAEALAHALGLQLPSIPWHSARDGFARLGAEAAILAGAAGKIARDVSLLMQPEVGEAFEPAAAGRGGSSSMPHKRNPVGCLLALEAAQRAPALAATLAAQMAPEHERGLGHWQSQWLTLRDLLAACAGALAAMAEAVEGLEVSPEAMRANLERSRGLVYSENLSLRLARTLGKAPAHALVETLCAAALREGIGLEEAARKHPQTAAALGAGELVQLFEPQSSFGAADEMIARTLDEWRAEAAAG